jgi:hypothetical protein
MVLSSLCFVKRGFDGKKFGYKIFNFYDKPQKPLLNQNEVN